MTTAELEPAFAAARDTGLLPVVLVGGLNLTRCLGPAGIPVIYATADPDDIALSSRYVRGRVLLPPKHVPERLADVLCEVGERVLERTGRRVPLFFGGDDEILAVAARRADITRFFSVLASEPGLDRAMLDKQACYELMAARGLPAPGLHRWEEVPRARGPLIIKPKIKTNWHGSPLFQELFGSEGKARIFPGPAALLADGAVRPFREQLLVQDYVPGGDDRILSFHCLADEQSAVMASFCGKKIRTFPAGTGESSFIELIRHDGLTRLGCEAVAKLGLQGPIKIDTKVHDDTGKIYLMEVNTRFTIWNYLGAANGINLPLAAYRYLVDGVRPEATGYDTRFRWLEPYLDYRAYRELQREGQLTLASWLGSLLEAPRVQDVFNWNDPLPFFKDVWRLMQSTVHRWRVSAS